MRISNKFIVSGNIQQIWDFLTDPEKMQKVVPGSESVERIDEASYRSIVRVTLGPIKLRFKTKIRIVESDPPTKLVSTIEGDDIAKLGSVVVIARYQLTKMNNEDTEIMYDAEANVRGKIAMFGDKTIMGKLRQMEDEFIDSLRKALLM